jgi:hypothetical protein
MCISGHGGYFFHSGWYFPVFACKSKAQSLIAEKHYNAGLTEHRSPRQGYAGGRGMMEFPGSFALY